MLVSKDILNEFKININEYEKGGWGQAINKFAVYSSIYQYWQTNPFSIFVNDGVTDPTDPNKKITLEVSNIDETDELFGSQKYKTYDLAVSSLISALQDKITITRDNAKAIIDKMISDGKIVINSEQETIFDGSKCFTEAAIKMFNILLGNYKYLRQIPDSSCLLENDIILIRYTIFAAIEFMSKNRMFWEIIATSNLNIGNSVSATVEPNQIVLTTDHFGSKALIYMTNADLHDYNIISDNEHELNIQNITKNNNLMYITSIKEVEQ